LRLLDLLRLKLESSKQDDKPLHIMIQLRDRDRKLKYIENILKDLKQRSNEQNKFFKRYLLKNFYI
jgi:hypothetical protein